MNNSKLTNSAVCIAGAHRSGTSMLTRLLHVCGLNLGPEADLMPARPDNPDGFWENLRFVSLNEELLSELGGAWDLPPRTDEDFGDDRLEPLRMKARLVVGGFDPASPWGWKDPRNSLTLPFWKSILPGLKVLVIVRNPLEVAHSMRERNGTSYSFGVRLWEIYNRRIIETTTPEERLLTHYDFFFDNCQSELKRIANFVGLPDSEVGHAADLIATGRRHTHFTMEQLVDARVSAEVVDFYRRLADEAEGNVLRADSVPGHSEIEGSELRPYATPEALRSAEEDLVPGTVSRIRISIPEREAKLTELTLHLAQQDAEMENIRARFIQTNQLLHSKSISLAEQEARSVTLTEHLRKQLQATKKLVGLLKDADRASERLRQSRRWKISNPFAWLGSKLSSRSLPGFGDLDKTVDRFRQWRSTHPEAEEIEAAIQALKPRTTNSAPVLSKLGAGLLKGAIHSLEPLTPLKPIEFPVHEQVEISLIIPVFNNYHFTQACLASVQENHDHARFEVIVVDDCSTDATAEIIQKIPGIIHLCNESNLGFIASCNYGARKARGTYLVFLNNDTVVTPGWLAALRETFEFEPSAGLVGSKLVFPDGRLQEAGGIIWGDASGWNRGKFQDPEKPEYNFLREVDYCSAASLMIPKSLFDRLGGFDAKYAPGYYEDTDLAFKLRDAGYKVLYQPLSKVIHFEGATGGTDISAGAKRYQNINRATFAASWAEILAKKPANGDIVALEALEAGRKRILVIDHHLPTPDRDSGSLRMFQMLKILHELGHRVSFLPDNLMDTPPYGDDLRKRGIEVLHYPYIKNVREYLQTYGSGFDVIILSRCDFARKHIADARAYAPRARIIFDTVDLHFLREARQAEATGDSELRAKATEKQKLEYDLIAQADQTWVVSPAEQELLRSVRPDSSIEVVSNIVDLPGSATPFSHRRDILFVGSFQHPPNTDAVLFFTEQIFPLVQNGLPGVKFYIIGDKAPPEVIALASEHVIVAGFQPDIGVFFDTIKLSVAPLRYGAGVKGKINQSMGFGVPVVATPIAIEGMSLNPNQDVMVADEPQSFAAAVIQLYRSEELWTQLSRNGLFKTKESFSAEAARKQLGRLLGHNGSQLDEAQSTRRGIEQSQTARPASAAMA